MKETSNPVSTPNVSPGLPHLAMPPDNVMDIGHRPVVSSITLDYQLSAFPNNPIATLCAVGTCLALYINAKFSVIGPQQTFSGMWLSQTGKIGTCLPIKTFGFERVIRREKKTSGWW